MRQSEGERAGEGRRQACRESRGGRGRGPSETEQLSAHWSLPEIPSLRSRDTLLILPTNPHLCLSEFE